MIEIKTVRRAPAYHRCPVCRAALATNGSNTRVTIDAETEATAITTLTHPRARVFLIGYPDGQPWDVRRPARPRKAARGRPLGQPAGPGLGVLMPTLTASDYKAGFHQESTGYSLTQAVQLLPTPQAVNATRSSAGYGQNLHEVATGTDMSSFGPYAPAIARWEQITGRAAPPPSTPSRRAGGKPQLSARFAEWMMGLPDGHVTGPDLALPREHQLRLLGNGVVPQQAALAVRQLIQTVRKFDK